MQCFPNKLQKYLKNDKKFIEEIKKNERGPDKFCIYRKIFVLKCKLLKMDLIDI